MLTRTFNFLSLFLFISNLSLRKRIHRMRRERGVIHDAPRLQLRGHSQRERVEITKRVKQSAFCTRSPLQTVAFHRVTSVTAFSPGYLICRLINTMESVCGRRGFGTLHVTLRAYHPLFCPLLAALSHSLPGA